MSKSKEVTPKVPPLKSESKPIRIQIKVERKDEAGSFTAFLDLSGTDPYIEMDSINSYKRVKISNVTTLVEALLLVKKEAEKYVKQ